MKNASPVLVLGAAGFLGMHAVTALSDEGRLVRAGRRRTTNVLALRRLRVPMVRADLDDPDSLVEAMAGCEVVVHCAAHYPRLSVWPDETVATGTRQTRHVLDAAAEAGVRHLVYVSSTATVAPTPDGTPSTEADVWRIAPGFGPYHDVKWAMEALVAQESRLRTTTLCPGACLGTWDLRVGTSALLVALARDLDPPHPDGWVPLVDAADVGRAVARLVARSDSPSRLLLAGSNHRLHRLLQRLAPRFGARAPRAPLSAAQARGLADREERACAERGGRPMLSREIVDLVVQGVPVDASLATSSLDLEWTPLDRTLDAWATWARRLSIIPPAPAEVS